MSNNIQTYIGGLIFDGHKLLEDHALRIEEGVVKAFATTKTVEKLGNIVDLAGDILSPGFIDLQVNGGGGVMFNDAPTFESLKIIAKAHRGLGTDLILPTLITDNRKHLRMAIDAVEDAIAAKIEGIGGLHLEGPHLSIRRKGAHDPDLIRKMDDEDVEMLTQAAQRLPVLMVTVAPENVTIDQVNHLARAGILLSLGHSDADYETCMKYQEAGVRAVTHLFNAMSQIGNREPGLVGAALDNDKLFAGLIADGIHVHPANIRMAFNAKHQGAGIYLVSDAMATAGSQIDNFSLNGRNITRADGRLTLDDGTLAGADLELGRAIEILTKEVGIPLEIALRSATSIPANLAGLSGGRIVTGKTARLIRIPNFAIR